MIVLTSIEELPNNLPNPVLTIGNFDGLHQGHLHLITSLKEHAGPEGTCIVITFSNHPSEVLAKPKTPLLCSVQQKINLFANTGIDILVLLEFTHEFSQQNAEDFIKSIRLHLLFTTLLLGEGASFGKDRKGTAKTLSTLSQEEHFSLVYIEPKKHEGQVISSTWIRNALTDGNMELVKLLLERPYSIRAYVVQGHQEGRRLGFPTANIDLSSALLPPLGVYGVHMHWGDRIFSGIANLGTAPTLKKSPVPLLEVHLFDCDAELYDQEVEVFFDRYVRPEMEFKDTNALREQILKDIAFVKNS